MTGIYRYVRKVRAFVWRVFALSCIGLAVLVGLGGLLVPYADRFQGEVEGWLAERLSREVTLAALEARWSASGPRLLLRDIALGDAASGKLEIDLAEVSFDIYSWLRPGSGGAIHFRISSDTVELVHGDEGQWWLGDIQLWPTAGDGFDFQKLPGLVGLQTNELVIREARSGRATALKNLDLSLTRDGKNFALAGSVQSTASTGLLQAVVKIVPDQGFPRLGDVYLRGRDLRLDHWLGDFSIAGAKPVQGLARFELWGEPGTEFGLLRGRVALDDLRLAAAQSLAAGSPALLPDYTLERIAAEVQLRQYEDGGWRLDLTDVEFARGGQKWQETDLVVARYQQGLGFQYAVAGDFLRLEDVVDALAVFDRLPGETSQVITALAPRGMVTDFKIGELTPTWPPSASGDLTFENLSLRPYRGVPGLSGISGTVSLVDAKGTAKVAATDVSIEFPGALRWPLPLERVSADVHWYRRADQWELEIAKFALGSTSVDATGRIHLWLGQGKPFVDAQVSVLAGKVAEAKRFWPTNRFKPRLLEWLDAALVEGQITGGSALLHGDMDDWPFAGAEGRFEARAAIAGATLNLHPDWPVMREVAADFRFDASGMDASVASGLVEEIQVKAVEVELPNYRAPRLVASIRGRAEGSSLLAFLRQTPLHQEYAEYMDTADVAGASEIWARLELPLRPDLPPRKVTGHVWLEDARIAAQQWDVLLEGTTGRIDYSDLGFEARELDTQFRGFDAKLGVRSGAYVQDASLAAEIDLETRAPAGIFLADVPALKPLIARISEACIWRVALDVPIVQSAPASGSRLRLSSDLIDTTVALPPPFAKPAGVKMHVDIERQLSGMGDGFSVRVGDLLHLRASRSAGVWAAAAQFGLGEASQPPSQGLSLDGTIDYLDFDRWRDLASEFGNMELPYEKQNWLQEMDLTIDRLRFAGRDLSHTQITAQQDPEYWNLAFAGDQIEGRLRLPLAPDGSRLMLGEFDRLHWPDNTEDTLYAGLHPRRLPPIQFLADDVRIEGVELGRVRFESYPTVEGMRIIQFQAESPVMSINASGDWLGAEVEGETRSRFDATITGEDLGHILTAFGFGGVVEGGQSVVRLDAVWPGAPSDLEFAILGGEMSVEIGRGRIVEVDPGAGRLFGLLSLQALPRRLALDFADLFSSGLVFDGVSGRFRLEAGNAYTSDLTIDGPTAQIFVVGRTGLAAQDYDQIITVVPSVGSALPLFGALAGGGAGAAAAILLQNVFSNQIDRITRYHYSVSGPWEDPKVELLGADDAETGQRDADSSDRG